MPSRTHGTQRSQSPPPRAAATPRVVLWFEHDSYDQLILAHVLHAFAAHGAPVALAARREPPLAELAARIAELYPDDAATGFAAGDFRGVFWVEYRP